MTFGASTGKRTPHLHSFADSAQLCDGLLARFRDELISSSSMATCFDRAEPIHRRRLRPRVRGRVASALAVWRGMTWAEAPASPRDVHVGVAADVRNSVPDSMIRSRSARPSIFSGYPRVVESNDATRPRTRQPPPTVRRCGRSTTASRHRRCGSWRSPRHLRAHRRRSRQVLRRG